MNGLAIRHLQTLLIFLFIILAASCGLPGEGSSNSETIDTYQTEDTFDTADLQQVSGTGTLFFDTLVTSETHGFRLTFVLPEEDSSITLIAFTNEDLSEGMQVQFSRSGSNLNAALGTSTPLVDFSNNSDIQNFLGVDEQRFAIEVGSNLPSVLVWDDTGTDFERSTAILDSSTEVFSTALSSTRWALVLSNATVTRAFVSQALLE